MNTLIADIREANKPRDIGGGLTFLSEDIEYDTSNSSSTLFAGAYALLTNLVDIELDQDIEDLRDALEAEGEYIAKGAATFKRYDEFRADRLG